MSIHKKIPGVFDSARDSVPVAHDDSTTLLGICTHEAGRCLKVFKRTRPLPPQDTTQPPPPAEQPTERTAWSGAWFSGKTPHDGQTALKRASSLGADPVRSRATPTRDFRKALCMGGVFAVSTVLPEKIQHLAYHLETFRQIAPVEVLEHSLQVLGCFLVVSVLIWASKSEPHPVRPLLAYPPHNSETVSVHIAGLALGVVLMLT